MLGIWRELVDYSSSSIIEDHLHALRVLNYATVCELTFVILYEIDCGFLNSFGRVLTLVRSRKVGLCLNQIYLA